jgi:WD40 repeat protein
MVAVVGPSGSGKSSVVHAGLLAQLRTQDNWLITKFRPGSQPFNALAGVLIPHLEPNLSKTEQLVEINKLANALLGQEITLIDVMQSILENYPPGTRIPLVGDQFEELYTLVPEAALRSRFMDILTDAVFDQQYRPSPIFSLILTLRADFLGQALAHRPFADAIQEADVKLGPMTHNELNRAIVNPAKKLEVDFETGLTARILEDVGDEPGNLPLLEFALSQLWERQDGGLLTHQSYEDIERVHGALARHADAVYDGLKPEDQAAARRVFIQVVRPGEGTEDTRRMATRSELGEDTSGLIQQLADSRLLVTGSDSTGRETVEVVHEALIRGWGRLRKWMNADREFRVWQERLRALIRGWEASERDEGGLLRGLPLATAERWLAEREGDLSELEKEFIQASLAERERSEEAKREQQERERGLERAALRRLRVIVTVLVTASIVGIALTVAIFNQSRIAQRRADEVQSLSLVGSAEQAFENNNPELALALIMEANKIDEPLPEVLPAMRRIAYAPGVVRVIQAHDSPIADLHLSPDERFLVSASGRQDLNQPVTEDNSLALWDLETGAEVQRFTGHTDRPIHVEFSPDGRYLLSTAVDGDFILWDRETGEEVRRYQGQLPFPGDVRYLNYRLENSSGPTAIFWTVRPNEEIDDPFSPFFIADMAIEVVDLNSGEVIRQFRAPSPELFIKQSTLSEDRRLLITSLNSQVNTNKNAPYDGRDTLIAWDLATGEELQRVEVDEPGYWTTSIRISPNGKIAAIGLESSTDGILLIWDLESWDVLRRDFGNGVHLNSFNPQGDALYIHGLRGVQHIDPHNGDIVKELSESPGQLTYSEDGQRLLSFFPMLLWDAASGEPLTRFTTTDRLTVGRFLPDGLTAMTGHESGLVRFWEVKPGVDQQTAAEARILNGHGNGVTEVIFSPDGRFAVSAGGDVRSGTVVPGDNGLILWDLETGEIVRRYEGHEAVVWSLAFSPDGRLVASGAQDESVILWDVESGEQVQRWDELGENVMALSFTPSGNAVLAGIGSPFENFALEESLLLLDVGTGAILQRFELKDGGNLPHVWSVAVSPDGLTALSGFFPSGIIHWDLETGEEIRRFSDVSKGNRGAVEGLAFSSDSQIFLSAASDGSIILWDVQTGEQVRQYPTDGDSTPHRVAISPDGNSVVATFGPSGIAGEGTKAVIMWDLESGEEIQRFEGHTDWVRGVDFSPDGAQVISSSGDGTVRLWNVVGGDLLEWIANNRYVRELTDEEREQFRLSP